MTSRWPVQDRCYVGVDVGSSSVRAALVSHDGRIIATAEEPIHIWQPQTDHYEQSSEDIWRKCCSTVKKVTAGIMKERVRGIGFDATCSLVVLDRNFRPVAVNKDGVSERNVVMWMDHRATEQASRITATKHRVLNAVGESRAKLLAGSDSLLRPARLFILENDRISSKV
ncbi:FGGY carbohydrate kinase domain-containing protein [Bagarius yarrelli]|uniref:FGGY carbohydrate kinase domain-containing protein n=1 Tax=Bagarius yarrelli TaxID=175774 RepID=A0A556V0Y9_BAGYA|nr:FGGY carbohydrate kinase domain-containing protein [Bagarius yarrelli]